jgi:spore maturation protein CgeB
VRILYTGPLTEGHTCDLRRRALQRLGHEVVGLDYLQYCKPYSRLSRHLQWRFRSGPMVAAYNQALENTLSNYRPDVLWVDKGIFIRKSVLQQARKKAGKLVHYSPDNYFIRQNSSRHLSASLSLFDLVVTTKTSNVMPLKEAGARRVKLSGNAFDPEIHKPLDLSDEDKQKYECEVSFIGRWEPLRESWLNELLACGLNVSIGGSSWHRARRKMVRQALRGEVLGVEYAKAINAAKINLAFLSRTAGDNITQRSVEIPACGGFMLAERTREHLDHFREDVEAGFFDGLDELKARIEHFLREPAIRTKIAEAGRERCRLSGYSYDTRLQAIIDETFDARSN